METTVVSSGRSLVKALRLIGAMFLVILLSTCTAAVATAQRLPGDSATLLPLLDAEIEKYWGVLYPRSFVAGVIDQESNWRIKAQLKTSRELGCGLGQFTIAYDAKGNVRFDALTETRRLDPSLREWDWRDCSAAQFQLRAVTLKLRMHDRNCGPLMATNLDVKACAAAQYNGGAGSVNKRIRYCRLVKGCKPDTWMNNLETQCPQSKVVHAGYGESFCEINSKYPRRVFNRMNKFEAYFISKPLALPLKIVVPIK